MFIDKTKEINNCAIHHDGQEYKARVEYGMQYLHNNEIPPIDNPDMGPRFIVRGQTIYRHLPSVNQWIHDFNGLTNEEVLHHVSSISALQRFNQWHQDGLPLRYMDYSIYCYSIHKRWVSGFMDREITDRQSAEYFTRFSKHVLLQEDDLKIVSEISRVSDLEKWLICRKPYLQSLFHETTKRYEVEYITQEEILALHNRMKANREREKTEWGLAGKE